MSTGNKKCNLIALIGGLALLVLLVYMANRLFMPKYISACEEGSLIEEYYDSPKVHDVIFLGDCEVFSTYSPCYMWENYGVSSYVRGSAQQLIWQSYYILKDTLRYEKPQVVVINVQALKTGEQTNEAYNRMTIDGMKWSSVKAECIKDSMMDNEHFIDYVFPLLRFHSRWNELTKEDFVHIFAKDKMSSEGFIVKTGVKPVANLPEPKILSSYELPERTMSYLEKIVDVCNEEGIELVLVKAPSVYPHWYDEWEEQVVDFADLHGIKYFNLLKADIGIDYNTDTFDSGLHVNLAGAEKCSDYLAQILVNECNVTDRRDNQKYVDIWQEKIDLYNRMIAECEEE